jgi:hypothetical protein
MRKAIKPEVKLGAERKKVIALGALLAIAAAVYFFNGSDTPSNPPSQNAGRNAIAPAPGIRTPVRPASRAARRATVGARGASLQEFHPTLKPKEPIDTARVDPTLRLDLLAKLQNVKLEGGARSLFDFGGAPAATDNKIATVKPIVPGPLQSAMTTGPVKPKPPAAPPPPPPPPPIPLKFYGYTNAQQRQGPKRAFFLEGEDIHVAGEGEIIKNRYKMVRIGVNSAVVEDMTNKNQQTLPLIAEMVNS